MRIVCLSGILALALCVLPALLLAQVSGSVEPDSAATLPVGDLSEVTQPAPLPPVPPSDYSPKWYKTITNIPTDWVRFSPLAFRSDRVPLIVGITAMTGVLLIADDALWQESHRWYRSSKTVADVSDFFEYLGDGRPQFGLAGTFALYGLVSSDRRSLRTASQLVEGILACGIVVQALKHMTGRESPFVSTVPGGRWDLFPNQIDYHKHVPKFDAYPSGHVATALLTVTIVAENYPEWWWVKPIGYVLVGGIAVGMGNTGIHWYSDYPLGLALGYGFGMIVSHPELLSGEATLEKEKSGLTLGPYLGVRGAGVSIAYSF
jgi:membrane-associated phospholipid phosphatase